MIYFIRAGGVVKIGYTGRDPRQRLADLQTSNHRKLYLLATIPGTLEDEARLHRRFDAERISGEWFTYSRRIKTLLRSFDGFNLADPMSEPEAAEPIWDETTISEDVPLVIDQVLNVWPAGETAVHTATLLELLRAEYPGEYDAHTVKTLSVTIPRPSRQVWRHGRNLRGYRLDDVSLIGGGR